MSNVKIQMPSQILHGDEIRNRSFFHSRSPLTFIEQCKTPTLVLHGDKDERVPLASGRSWHRGLQFAPIETEMVVYPRGGHLLTRRDLQLDVMRSVLAWYERHLREP
jgi:dipeptidyl aminopeptidase/acylaminoacyl peptidase